MKTYLQRTTETTNNQSLFNKAKKEPFFKSNSIFRQSVVQKKSDDAIGAPQQEPQEQNRQNKSANSKTEYTGSSFVFNEGGTYVRTDKTNKQDNLVIENSKNGERKDYDFHDPAVDIADIKYNIQKFGAKFKEMPFLFHITSSDIEFMMKDSDIHYRNWVSRRYFAATESNSGKMDFSAYQLGRYLAHVKEEKTWDWNTEISQDKGPVFIITSQRTVYNLMDMGNWLWGNAVNRLGGAQTDAKGWSLRNDPNDSDADQDAIQNGWFYQDGYRDMKDCPVNR